MKILRIAAVGVFMVGMLVGIAVGAEAKSPIHLASSRQRVQVPTDPEVLSERYDRYGVLVSRSCKKPLIYLFFSADSMFEGGEYALDILERKEIKASFFFTGNFLRDSAHHAITQRIISGGHYVGPHSDKHLLLADWDGKRTPLVTVDSMLTDLRHNMAELARAGVDTAGCRWIMPPFEWIAACQVEPLINAGFRVVNPTPNISTYRDYTTPDMPDYRSSEEIINQLFEYESAHSLNGAFVIIHLGTEDSRTDKLYHHLEQIIDTLVGKGYSFVRLP